MWRLLAAVVVAASVAALARQPEPAGGVRIVPSPAGSGPEDTTYEIRSGPCRIRWTVSKSGVNEGIAQHRANCQLSLAEQVALNGKILDSVLAKEPAFRSVFLGSIAPFPELAERLAVAAKRSPDWDVRSGRPKGTQPIAGLVRGVMSSDPAVFAEWRGLFEDRGLTFAVTGVEHVTVSEARASPLNRRLQALGVSATDRVPLSCLVWFSATRRQ